MGEQSCGATIHCILLCGIGSPILRRCRASANVGYDEQPYIVLREMRNAETDSKVIILNPNDGNGDHLTGELMSM